MNRWVNDIKVSTIIYNLHGDNVDTNDQIKEMAILIVILVNVIERVSYSLYVLKLLHIRIRIFVTL